MDINKKNRVELKNYFKKNAIPTEANFADFIDAGINEKEDGLYKPQGDPLHIEASLLAPKTAIKLYETFTGSPSWAVSLQEPGSGTSGFAVSDTGGATRLWIGTSDGVVHVGSPSSPGGLTAGSITATGAVSAGSITTSGTVSTGATTVTTLTATGLVSAQAGVNVTGGPLNVGTSSITAQPLNVYGALTANSTINATGLITATGGITTGGNIQTATFTATNTLTANGGITTNGTSVINANGGLNVATGKTLQVNGTLTAQATSTTTLGATGLITAGAGVSVSAGSLLANNIGPYSGSRTTISNDLTVSGTVNLNGFTTTGSVSVGTAGNPQTLYTYGQLTAMAGIIVPSGQNLAVGGTTTLGTTNTGILNAGNLITASGGITVPIGQTLAVSGSTSLGTTTTGGLTTAAVNASGITIPNPYTLYVGGTTSLVGAVTANAGMTLTSSGSLTVNIPTYANGGFSVPSYQAATIDGQLITNGPVTMSGYAIDIGPKINYGVHLEKLLSGYGSMPTIPNTVPFDTGVTIQARIFLHNLEDFARIVDLGNAAASDNIMFYVFADGSLGCQVYRGGVAGAAYRSASSLLSVGRWTWVAMTVDNTGQFKVYKDGTLVGTSAASSTNIPIAITRTSNLVGKSNASGPPFFSGLYSELSLSHGVRAVTTAPLAGNETGLIGYWQTSTFDSCTNSGHLGNMNIWGGATQTYAYDRGYDAVIRKEDWYQATLQGTWTLYSTSYTPPGFYKDALGMVHLRGILAPGGTGTAAFTVPSNYRCQYTERHPIAAATAGCYVEINNGGQIIISLSGTPAWVSLDGIRYRQHY